MAFKNYRKETSEREVMKPTGKNFIENRAIFLIQLKVAMKIKITL